MKHLTFKQWTLVLLGLVVSGGIFGVLAQEIFIKTDAFSSTQEIKTLYFLEKSAISEGSPDTSVSYSQIRFEADNQNLINVITCNTIGGCAFQEPKNKTGVNFSNVFGGENNANYSVTGESLIIGGNNNKLMIPTSNTVIGGSDNSEILKGSNNVVLGTLSGSVQGSNSNIIGSRMVKISGDNVAVIGGKNIQVTGNNIFLIGKNMISNHHGIFAFNAKDEIFSSQKANTFLINADYGLVINTDTPTPDSRVALTLQGNLKVGLENRSPDKNGSLISKTCNDGSVMQTCVCAYGSESDIRTLSDSEFCQQFCNMGGSTCPTIAAKCDPQRARVFSAAASNWPYNSSYCETGTPSQLVNFPAIGESVSWTCRGFGGAGTVSCSASRERTKAMCKTVILYPDTPNLNVLKNDGALCAVGTFGSGTWTNGQTTATWICNSPDGGTNAVCSATCPVGTILSNGICVYDGASTTPESCFVFNTIQRTITDYLVANPGCGTRVIIPTKISGVEVETLGSGAFAYKNLLSVTIPTSVTTIKNNAFKDNLLTGVIIPNSVTSLGSMAFIDNQLSSLVIGNAVPSIEFATFQGNQLTTLTIPNSVQSIKNQAFLNNKLTSVSFGNSLTSIGFMAFQNNLINTLSLPNSLTSIGSQAFNYNKLTSLTLPNSVTLVESGAFAHNLLTQVTLSNAMTSVEENTFLNNQLTTVTLGNALTTIKKQAFQNNQLISLIIPNAVTTIGNLAFANNPGKSQYSNKVEGIIAKNPSSVSVASDANIHLVQQVPVTPEYCFEFSGGTISNYRKGAYPECGPDVNIPATIGGTPVIALGYQSFFEKDLTSAIIPNSVKTIGDWAFKYNLLTSIIIPDSVTSMGDLTFMGNQLTSVTLGNGINKIGYATFQENKIVSVSIPDSVTIIDKQAFLNNKIASLSLGSGLTSIGFMAFQNNKLTSLTIPHGVHTLYTQAFRYNLLTSLNLPSTLTTLGGAAFADNQLTSITIPDALTTISSSAFLNNKLTSVILGTGTVNIQQQAFQNNKLTSITFPNTVEELGDMAFATNPGKPQYGGKVEGLIHKAPATVTVGYNANIQFVEIP